MKQQSNLTITWQDIYEGRAFIRLPDEAKLKLAELCGAPWSPQDPSATLSDFQKEVLLRPDRIKVIGGAARSGKSVLGAVEGLCELALPNTQIACVGGNYDHAAKEFDFIHRGFLRVFGVDAATRCINVNSIRSHDMEISTVWGSKIRAYSTEKGDGDSLLGNEWDLAIAAEGSKVSASAYRRKLWRALAGRVKKMKGVGYTKRTGRFCVYTTPDGFDGCNADIIEQVNKETKNKPEQKHFPNCPWQESVYIREVDALENPGYDVKEYMAAKKKLNPDEFAEQFQGKMVHKSGNIIAEFNPAIHIKTMPDLETLRKMQFGVSIDTGKVFAATLMGRLGVAPNDVYWVLGETYSIAVFTSEFTASVKEMVTEILTPVFQTGPEHLTFDDLAKKIDCWSVDPAASFPIKLDLESQFGIGLLFDKIDWDATINKCRDLFFGRRLFLVDTLPNLTHEITKYRWKMKLSGSMNQGNAVGKPEPGESPDHALDTMRYNLHFLEQVLPREEPIIEKSMDEIWAEARDNVFKFGEAPEPKDVGEAYRYVHH